MADYDGTAMRWVDIMLGKTTKPALKGNPDSGYPRGRMYSVDRRMLSYGEHFEICRYIPASKHNAELFLFNGATYGNTTGKQQSAMRGAVARSGVPTVIIPYDSLVSAGIDFDTIRLIDRTADTSLVTEHDYDTLPPRAVWKTEDVLDYTNAGYPNNDYSKPYVYPVVTGTKQVCYTSARSGWTWDVTDNTDGTKHYHRETRRHLLGESLITAEVIYVVRKKCAACGGFGRRPGPAAWGPVDNVDGFGWRNHHLCFVCNGQVEVAQVKRRRAYFLSGFDANETRPSYFFTELPPKVKPTTVAEAYETLKPEAVKLAEQMGRTVKRQGDVFAIETAYSKRDLNKMGATFARTAFILNVNHKATEVATLPDGSTLVRGSLTHDPGAWRRPDHKRVSLGNRWHIAQKNTTPLSK